jgi:N-acetylglucosamine-6-phosphate deacetylase
MARKVRTYALSGSNVWLEETLKNSGMMTAAASQEASMIASQYICSFENIRDTASNLMQGDG